MSQLSPIRHYGMRSLLSGFPFCWRKSPAEFEPQNSGGESFPLSPETDTPMHISTYHFHHFVHLCPMVISAYVVRECKLRIRTRDRESDRTVPDHVSQYVIYDERTGEVWRVKVMKGSRHMVGFSPSPQTLDQLSSRSKSACSSFTPSLYRIL